MIGILWLFGIVCCWIPFSIALVRWFDGNSYSGPDPEDLLFSVFVGLCASLVWPITLLILGVAKIVQRTLEAIKREEENA